MVVIPLRHRCQRLRATTFHLHTLSLLSRTWKPWQKGSILHFLPCRSIHQMMNDSSSLTLFSTFYCAQLSGTFIFISYTRVHCYNLRTFLALSHCILSSSLHSSLNLPLTSERTVGAAFSVTRSIAILALVRPYLSYLLAFY